MKVGDEEALVTVSDGGYLVAEYEGRDVPLEDFKFDLESLVGELGDRFVLSDVVLECSGAECSQAVMESDVGGVSVSGVLDGRVWVSDGELRMVPVGSAGNVCEAGLIR